jgi:hypothetical protein
VVLSAQRDGVEGANPLRIIARGLGNDFRILIPPAQSVAAQQG